MTTTARNALAKQKGERTPQQLERAAVGVDVNSLFLDSASKNGLDVDFAASITDGYIERTMEGASIISIDIHDSTKKILRSGMFGTNDNTRLPIIDVKVEGLWFRLSEFDKEGEQIKLVFEDRIVAYLRAQRRPISASRGSCTRAQFIARMVREVKKEHINIFSPELAIKQPVAGQKPKKKTRSERKAEMAGGLLSTSDLKIKGVQASKNQLEVCEQVLDEGVHMGANKKVLISSIMCIIQESDAHNDKGEGGINVGPFNQNHLYWPASGNVATDAHAYFSSAIASDKATPAQHISDLVQSVQKSGAGASYYAQWRVEAEKIVEEYGTGTTGRSGSSYTKAYEFHRGPPDGPVNENTWDCSDRLVKEVQWRRFVVGNTFYIVQDKDLIGRKPVAEVSEDDEGIDSIDGNIASNIKVSEGKIHCRASRWFAPPGSVIKVKNHGPFTGRWLVFKIHRPLFSPACEVTIHQPEAAKPEPPHEVVQVPASTGEEGIVSGGIIAGKDQRERIVNAAKWGLKNKSKFTYNQVRPMAKSLFEKAAWNTTDCSAFATLCYKAAGVKDPNGFSYNGSGNTVSLKAQGNHTNTPEPGDLVFYNNPEHVAVFIGNGKVIELGGTPGPNEEPMNYRTVADIRNYSLEGSGGPVAPVIPRGKPPAKPAPGEALGPVSPLNPSFGEYFEGV